MKELNELEQKFEEALALAREEIKEYIVGIENNLKKITEISEKYGVPVHVNPDYLGNQDYLAISFAQKWPEIAAKYRSSYYDCYDFTDFSLYFRDKEHMIEGWHYSNLC